MNPLQARSIAFYLPQFHPVPENDEWWGKGFTEWINVSKARPLFPGHYQPHLPADLGFYDLRLPEVREAQASLAQEYGLEGFCYWHYWFHGKRILERPFQEVLASGKPDLPFCLAWANESWSRRWLGEERNVLMEQTYSESDDKDHARWLLPALADTRCIRVYGRPLFLIYRPTHLPDARRTVDILRNECIRAGLPNPYLLGIDAHCPGTDCRQFGFDGTLRFEPQLGVLPLAFDDEPSWRRLRQNMKLGVISRELKVYDYADARRLMSRTQLAHPYFQSVCVGWDNTARRGKKGVIMVNNTPEEFAKAIKIAVSNIQTRPNEEKLLFINAWNEWAEGNHLEPDQRNGLAHLEALRDVVISGHESSK
ncbi:MAG: glycoside hydrolase family 99-like domain-containing protein [Sulfuricellaceae bacterium]|nr:glycoside hydrolase family 99-like domain-containing protein [Sulfuricellaceae bacterium]